MDPPGEKKEREAKNNLAKKREGRAEDPWNELGWSPAVNKGQK